MAEEIEQWLKTLDVAKDEIQAYSVILSDEFSTVAEMKEKKPNLEQLLHFGIDDERGKFFQHTLFLKVGSVVVNVSLLAVSFILF